MINTIMDNNDTANHTGTTTYVALSEGEFSSQISLAIHVVTLAVGSIANLLVLAYIITKSKKTDQDIMIISLCLTDWTVIMVKFPLKLDTNLKYIHWTNFVCKFVEIIPTLCHYAGIYIIVVMAVHRCRILVNPFRAKMKLKSAVICCLVIWILSYLFLLPLTFIRTSYFGIFCGIVPLTDYEHYLFQVYRIIGYVIAFPIPFVLIAFSYIRLGLHLHRQRLPRVAYVEGNLNMNAGRRQNMEIIRTLTVIVIAFVAFMLPLFIVRVQYELKSNAERQAKEYLNFIVYTRLVALSHSCVNPIIYGIMTRHFRQKFKKWFCHCFQRNLNFGRMNTWNVQNMTASTNYEGGIIMKSGKFKERLDQDSKTVVLKRLHIAQIPRSREDQIGQSSVFELRK